MVQTENMDLTNGTSIKKFNSQFLPENSSIFFQGRKADILSVIFNTGDSRFLRIKSFGNFLLCKPGLFPRLLQKYANFEIPKTFLVSIREFGVLFFALTDISLEIAHWLSPFRT